MIYDCGNADITDTLDLSEINLDSLGKRKVSDSKDNRKFYMKKKDVVRKKDRCGAIGAAHQI